MKKIIVLLQILLHSKLLSAQITEAQLINWATKGKQGTGSGINYTFFGVSGNNPAFTKNDLGDSIEVKFHRQDYLVHQGTSYGGTYMGHGFRLSDLGINGAQEFSKIVLKSAGGTYYGSTDFLTLATRVFPNSYQYVNLPSASEISPIGDETNCTAYYPLHKKQVGISKTPPTGPGIQPINQVLYEKGEAGNFKASDWFWVYATDYHINFGIGWQKRLTNPTQFNCTLNQNAESTRIPEMTQTEYTAALNFRGNVYATLVFYKACDLLPPNNYFVSPISVVGTNTSVKLNIIPPTTNPAGTKYQAEIIFDQTNYPPEQAGSYTDNGYQRSAQVAITGSGIITFSNLAPGKKYKFRVRTVCPNGSLGKWTNNMNDVFTADPPLCLGNDEVKVRDEKPDVAQFKSMDLRFWLEAAMGKTFDQILITLPDNGIYRLPVGTYTYNFPNIGPHKIQFLTKRADGTICQQKFVYPNVFPCAKCLEDASVGANRSIFYCFANNLTSYPNLVFPYDCTNKSYRSYYTTGNGQINLPIERNVRMGMSSANMMYGNANPENLRPACNNVGGLKENMYAFKYAMPKAEPTADQKMTYILSTSGLMTGKHFRWRTIPIINQSAGTRLEIQRQTMIQDFAETGWQSVHIENLNNNMAKAPATPNSYGGGTPTHEYYSIPTAVGVGLWTYGKGSPGIWWMEKAINAATSVEVECRTYIKTLPESSAFYRVRVCNPCTIQGMTLSITNENNIKISTNGNLVTQNQATKLLGSTDGVNIYYDHTTNVATQLAGAMFNCEQYSAVFASAVKIMDLDPSCNIIPPSSVSVTSSRLLNSNGNSQQQLVSNKEILGMNSTSVHITPNPFTSQFTIEYTVQGNGSSFIQVCNVLGKLVYSSPRQTMQPGRNVQLQIPATNWAKGIYMATVYNGDGTTTTKKVVKE